MRQKRKEGSTERISSAKLNPVPATLFDVPKNDQTRLSDGSGISPGFREAGGKIRESEHLLRMVLDNSQDIFYCLNLQTGRYEYISPSAETTMGLSVGEFPAHDANSALAMIHPEDRSTVRAAYAELEKTGTAEVEYRQMTGSGEYRWLSNHLSLVRNKEGHPLFRTGHMTDISKRKHDERALRESEERFRLAARAGQAMIYDLDVGSLRINATHGMSDLLGFVPDEVDSTLQWWKSLINSDDLHFYHAAFEKMCSLHHDHILHYRVRRKDGREIWVEDHAAPVGKDGGELERIVGTVADITVRKRAEEALRISEEKFSKAFKNSPTAITITRLGDGRIIEGNDSSFAMFGFRAEEIIGKTTLEVGIWACPEDRKRLVSELSSKGIVKQREFVLQRKDRSLVTVDLSASLIIVENQQCLITSFVDITERKMAEDELRRSEDKFRRLATELTAINRDLDSFSYSVAHELRNPLNNINALFKLLLRDNRERLDENGDLCIDHIEKNIVRLASVISGLLGLSHVARHTLQIRKVDLTRIAWDATEQLR
jgi:PAS domain S-box-containing protein